MSDRVTVAVRVRPWTKGDSSTRRCTVRVDGTAAELLDPQTGNRRAHFAFDHVFSSLATDDAQAEQAAVFDALAPPLLDSALDGYNVTVFAYGQTASGKSYTMHGEPEAPGFTPRFVSSLFAACEATQRADPRADFAVEASFMEIYMENIRDLLQPAQRSHGGGGGAHGRAHSSLRVREHPRTGPYVEDLSKIACRTSAQVATLLEHGSSMRAVRATHMNAASSRSHAIFTLRLTQRRPRAEAEGAQGPGAGAQGAGAAGAAADDALEIASSVHLVDLAGSERAKRTGTAPLQV